MVALLAASGTRCWSRAAYHTTGAGRRGRAPRAPVAVVVGTAITHPTSITRWFARAVRG